VIGEEHTSPEEFAKNMKNLGYDFPDEPVDPDKQRHDELMEMLGGIFIQVSRMYDALIIALPPSAREEILEAHESGGLLGDPPALREDAWE
jgi:hypothetical protein